jgi:hypothetical protein
VGGDVVDIAGRLFAGRFDEWPGDAFELLAEDVVINPSDGHIYVGHEGYARWYREQIADHEDRSYAPESTEVLQENWALMRGAVHAVLRDGRQQVQPGCWLVHVREGLVAAVLYYRTEADARKALPG